MRRLTTLLLILTISACASHEERCADKGLTYEQCRDWYARLTAPYPAPAPMPVTCSSVAAGVTVITNCF